MLETLLWCWLVYLSLIIGACIGRGQHFTQNEGPLYSVACGFGALSLLVTALGFAGLLYAGLFWSLLIILTVVFTYLARKPMLHMYRTDIWGFWKELGDFSRFALILALLICVKNFLGALTPEVRHDVVDYHLNFPNLYVQSHGIVEAPWHVLSYMPAYVEMLYTLALSISTDVLAKLIHFGFSVLCALFLLNIGGRYFGRRSGELAMLFWLLTPKVAYETSTAYIDLGVSVWAFASIGMFLLYCEKINLLSPREDLRRYSGNAVRPLLFSGFFAGMALGSKYTAGPFFVLPTAAALFGAGLIRQKRSLSSRLFEAVKALAIWSLVVWLVASPWFIANYSWTGNPFYPIANSRVGLTEPYQLRAEQLFNEQRVDISTWGLYWRNWLGKINALALEGTLLVDLLFVLIVLIPLLRLTQRGESSSSGGKESDHLAMLLGVHFAIAYLCWIHLTNNLDGRFLMPSYLPLCLLLGWGYCRIADRVATLKKSPRLSERFLVVLVLLLAFSLVSSMTRFYADLEESPWPVLGTEAKGEYRRGKDSSYAMVQYIEEHTPEESRVLGVGFPLKRKYISHPKAGYHPFEDRFGVNYTTDQTIEALRQEGVDYIVIPNGFGMSSARIPELTKKGFRELVELDGKTLLQVP